MKRMKKIFALLLTLVVVFGTMSITAFAANQEHTITITNTDQYVPHTYEGYQVFSGDLSADGATMSNIAWGTGVDGPALLAALKASTSAALKGDDPLTDAVETDANIFASCLDAKDVAKVIGVYKDTAAVAEEFANVVSKNLKAAGKFSFTASGTTYTADVPSDGYYFVQDVTSSLTQENPDGSSQSDSLSKFILQVVQDVTVVAKDTGLYVDKSITGEGETRLKEGSSNIGDVIPYEVKTKVPDTSRFASYTLNMFDTLDAGLTYFGGLTVKLGDTTLSAGTDYEVTVTTGTSAFTTPTTVDAAITTTGGQTIKVVFKTIKTFGDVAANQGKDIVISYNVVLNKDATMGKTPNENEVYFEYSKNPNDETIIGETPKSVTKTYSTELDVLKVDGENQALEGAVFELSGTTYNFVVVDGEKYELTTYVAKDGETIDPSKTYWELIDGAFTAVDPSTVADTSKYVDPDVTYYKVTMANVVETTNGGTASIKVVSGADGKMQFTGLKPGTYTLTEIAAPDGFNKIVDPIKVVVTWDKDNGFKLGEGSDAGWTEKSEGSGTFKITIKNEAGTVLPTTGGIGTTIFYIIGSILVIGAGIALVSRRRMNEK